MCVPAPSFIRWVFGGFILFIEWLQFGMFLLVGLGLVIVVLSGVLGWALLHPPRVTAGIAASRGWWIDPADADLEFDEWIFDAAGEVNLPVWEIPNPDCPDGPVLFMSHCWGGSKVTSLQRIPFVFDQVSRLILWDMRGHGEAEGRGSRLGTIESDDLVKLIEQTSEGHPVILYGASLGAGISIMAATQCEQVIGVIADGPYRWTAEPVRSLLEINGIPHWPILPVVHRMICLFVPQLRKADRAQYARQMKCPLMIIHGTDDVVCSVNSAMEIAEAAPESDFIVIPNASHLDLHLKDPDRYRRTVSEFIRRCVRHARNRVEAPGEDAADA